MDPIRFAVVGFGGYALSHIASIQWLADQNLGRLTAVVALPSERDHAPERIQSLRDHSVALFDSIESFLSHGTGIADVLTVPIGIHQHVPLSIAAMQAGLDVYCEKPAAATIQDVDRLIAAQKKTGRRIAIGFQHIYSHSIQRLKALICQGGLGPVQAISLTCGWPRSRQYYDRNDWAGGFRCHDEWILDSPANNAHAHYLFNLLYLASSNPHQAACPVSVHAELYRANKIACADVTQIRLETDEGARGHIILAHCNKQVMGPLMHLQCAKGQADWQSDEGKTTVSLRSGRVESFDNQIHERWRSDGFKDLVQAIREQRNPLCTPALTRPHTVTINGMHESCPEIVDIPDLYVSEDEDWEMFPPDTKGDFRRVDQMDSHLHNAFRSGKFLSEMGIPWAQASSKPFDVKNYAHFPQIESSKASRVSGSN